jgi:hypothetical protein
MAGANVNIQNLQRDSNRQNSNIQQQGQGTQVAALPAVLAGAALNALRVAVVAAAKRYGPAGVSGFLVGMAIGNQLRVGATNPLAIGSIAAASRQLINMGILKPDQAVAFNTAAAAGLAAGSALPPMNIAGNDQIVGALSGALNMSESSVRNLLQTGQQEAEKIQATNGTGQNTDIASAKNPKNQANKVDQIATRQVGIS